MLLRTLEDKQMKIEVKRLDPVRTANIMGLVYIAISCVMTALMAPMLLMTTSLHGSFPLPGFFLLVSLISGPITGWIMGFLGSHTFNYIVRWTGGLRVEIDASAASLLPAQS